MKKVWKWIGIGLAALIVLGLIIPSEDTSSDYSNFESSTISSHVSSTTEKSSTTTTSTTTTTTVRATTTTTTTRATTPSITTQKTTQATSVEEMVWVSGTGKKYHCKSNCSGMKNPSQIPLSQAEQRGLTPCKNCY